MRDPDAASESLRCFSLGSSRSVQDRSEYGWLSCGSLVLCDPGDCEAGGAATGRVGSPFSLWFVIQYLV